MSCVMELPPHPSSRRWSTLIPTAGGCQEDSLLSSSSAPVSCLWQIHWPGSRSLELAREDSLLPQGFADVLRILGSGFSQDPSLLATWEFLCKIHTLFVFPSTQMEPLFG